MCNGNQRGFQHPECYANVLGNCSAKISREHYISANLLRRMYKLGGLQVSGLAWQNGQSPQSISPDSLTAKVLCTTHNSELHPLDDVALEFVKIVHKIDQENPPIELEASISGSELERWMLKLLIGICISRNKPVIIEPYWVDVLFRKAPWKPGTGLYFSLIGPTYHTNGLLLEFLSAPDLKLLAARVYLQGMPMTLCLGMPDIPEAFGMRRPRGLRFFRDDVESRLKFEWDDDFDEHAVVLRRTGTYDGNPPIW